MAVRRAVPADLPQIRALLVRADLPLDGADEAFATGVVAVVDGVIAGGAAIETYEAAGLLRSVVVDEAHRGTGIGRALVAAAEALALDLGVRDLYLLTETAIDWFPRLGFGVEQRSVVPGAITRSVEFAHACADTAVLMHRRLTTA